MRVAFTLPQLERLEHLAFETRLRGVALSKLFLEREAKRSDKLHWFDANKVKAWNEMFLSRCFDKLQDGIVTQDEYDELVEIAS